MIDWSMMNLKGCG